MFGPGVTGGVPGTRGLPAVQTFESTPVPVYFVPQYQLKGVTRNSSGFALGNCAVKLFNTATDFNEQDTVSNASGIYVFNVPDGQRTYYVVGYLAGSPDVAGTTVNTLVGA